MQGSIYEDIAKRTGGDIYIGVVGPVRTGKSTFIRKFIDSVVMPNIEDENDKLRTQDEIPQSASGRTIMTTEPKFVPDEAVKIKTDDGTNLNVKLIDCVGYIVDGALGAVEEGQTRMVMTPWSDEPMPFIEAAELGTKKVIGEHSTIAILVTTDGSIADIEREKYIAAEERIAKELTDAKKPFAILLNSKEPNSASARTLAEELESKYGAPVALLNCTEINEKDAGEILRLVLSQFPIKTLTFNLPEWTAALPEGHRILNESMEKIKALAEQCKKLGDVDAAVASCVGIVKDSVDAGEGNAEFKIPLSHEEYYSTLSELSGIKISNEKELLETVMRLGKVDGEYSRIQDALYDAMEKGYGIVMPEREMIRLEEPRLTRQAGAFGVKVSARAEAIHMIKTDVKTELCPVVGSEDQTEEVVKFLLDEYAEDPKRVLEYNMLGKSLYDLVCDGLNSKLDSIADDSRAKLGETLEKVVNEGANGLICILL